MPEALEQVARVLMYASLATFVILWTLALSIFTWHKGVRARKVRLKTTSPVESALRTFLQKHWHTFTLVFLTVLLIWRFKALNPRAFAWLMEEYPEVIWFLPVAVISACTIFRLKKFGPYFAGVALWLWLMTALQVPNIGQMGREVLFGIQTDLRLLGGEGARLLLGEAQSASPRKQN